MPFSEKNLIFADCKMLESVTFGKTTTIPSSAFSGCENLQYNVKNDLKYLGNDSNKYLYLAGTTSKNINKNLNLKTKYRIIRLSL